jgi:hypothetical protein
LREEENQKDCVDQTKRNSILVCIHFILVIGIIIISQSS